MMQAIAGIEIRKGDASRVHIGVPLFLVGLVALPFVLVLAPVAIVACLVMQVNPLQAAWEIRQVLASLKDTQVEIEEGPNTVTVHIP
jgi:hypothetical protein